MAGDPPVAKAVLDGLFPPAEIDQVVCDGIERLEILHAVEGAGIDQDPLTCIGFGHRLDIQGAVGGLDDDNEGQVEFFGKLEIPLIMGGDRHDAAGAIVGQHEVGGENRHLPARDGVEAMGVEEDSLLFVVLGGAHLFVLLLDLFDELQHRPFASLAPHEVHHERMFGGHQHEGGAEEGVLAGREDLDVSFAVGHREGGFAAVAFSDPVLLHGEDPLGPPGQPVAVVQELLDVVRDPEEPLAQVFFAHLGATAPTEARLHLLVGQNGLALGAPVHRRTFLVGETLFIHLEKEELFPSVIFGFAGRKLPIPVVAEAHPLELSLHVFNVFMGPDGGMDAPFDGCVFRRHSECVPTHRMEDVKTLHPLVSCDDVADGVVPHMTDMNPSGRIGKHLQKVIFFPVRVFRDAKDLFLIPVLLPLFFNFLRGVLSFHACFLFSSEVLGAFRSTSGRAFQRNC